MSSRDLATLLLLCLVAAPAAATYAGDHPLEQAYAGDLNGGYLYTTGNGTYSGTLEPGASYAVGYTLSLPSGAEVRFGRLYLYWAWSKRGQAAVYPEIAVEIDGVPVERTERYVDSKGFVSKNDFFSGVDVFDLPDLGSGNLPLVVRNAAAGNATFVVQGAAVLAVYETPDQRPVKIWVLEGSDLLYSSYGITPEMATSTMAFDGEIDTSRVESAELFLAAPSGGYTTTEVPEKNTLAFNGSGKSDLPTFLQAILDLVFPTANGKVWTDVFDADEERQVGTEKKDVTAWLRPSGNTAAVGDNGDYIQLTNAVLEVRFVP